MKKTSEYVVTDVAEDVLATYNLCLIGPVDARGPAHSTRLTPEYVREITQNINDLLPAGFRVVIREWNDEEETP